MLKAGLKAPDFTLADASGAPHSLSGVLARGPALIALYKVSCPVCQLTFPFLERISQGSVQVLGISQDDDRATRKFQKTYAPAVTMLLDPEREDFPVSNAFAISHVPSLFLVEQDGTISLAAEGFVKSDLEAIGNRAGAPPFRAEDRVPDWKAG